MSDSPITNAERVTQLHRAFGFTVPEQPTVPSPDLLKLRRTFIREEASELEAEFTALLTQLQAGEPVSPGDLTPLAHELTDLLYVTYGALTTLGIDADAVFTEVHHANMAKLGGPRREDGKLLKPEGWQPADVRGVIEGQGMGSGQ
ncbi:putative HAD superfamily Cof-like phosphohydrolase [Deinococcus sp. HSC-46F16]|uniref:hypothetical protein n=1 Tax=Deinococcus sp. HSC-46F16 TaxID=2910968 RepID=UPI0020A00D8D|nr:putative HAD superfamily Cof-like phosphohydrolase [Deinococcus sp. HSC-46F16]